MAVLTPTQKFAGTLAEALGRLRELHGDMTVLQILVLLEVAKQESVTQSDLYRRLGVTDSAISRNIALLSDIGGRRTAPLNLIDVRVNPRDRRERNLSLTRKGQRLIDDMRGDLVAA